MQNINNPYKCKTTPNIVSILSIKSKKDDESNTIHHHKCGIEHDPISSLNKKLKLEKDKNLQCNNLQELNLGPMN